MSQLNSTMKTKPKHILMLLENESVPDDNRVLLEAESLVEAGYAVTVICPTGESKKWSEAIGSFHAYRYPKPAEIDGFLGYAWEYGYSLTMMFIYSWFVLLRRGFDVIHVHTPPDMTALIAIFYQFFGKKFVFDLHDLSPELYLARGGNEEPNKIYHVLRYFERVACRNADRLIATNETQRSVQIDRCGAKPSDCYVVRNGPNVFFLENVEPISMLRNTGKLILGYVGVIGIQDGVDYFIRTLHELKVRHGRRDFMAVIVGNGPAMGELKRLAEELDVLDSIHFTGMIPFPTVPAHIAAFDICFTPDPSNAYNDSCTTIKTMEYMALRKPTVCFRTRENELTAGESAIYADNNDIEDYARATVRLMDDPALREKLGIIGRERVDNGLTWEHQAKQLIALYDDLFDMPVRPTSGVSIAEDMTPHAETEAAGV